MGSPGRMLPGPPVSKCSLSAGASAAGSAIGQVVGFCSTYGSEQSHRHPALASQSLRYPVSHRTQPGHQSLCTAWTRCAARAPEPRWSAPRWAPARERRPAMGLLTIIKKVKQKEKEMRFLMVYAPRACVHLSMCFSQRRVFA